MDVNPTHESVMNHKMAMDVTVDGMQPDWMTKPLSAGTTIVASEFNGGVVIGADSRTSTGSYVANRVTDKLGKVTNWIYCCRSGSAADTQAISEIVSYHLNFHEMEMNEPPLVKTAANVFHDLQYSYRDQLLAGIIVAGWDKRHGGQVYSLPVGGMLTRRQFELAGSGASYIWGYGDTHFKPNMTKDECVNFVKNAIALAISRDTASGGVIRIAVITEKGAERMTFKGSEIPKFFMD